MTGHPVESLVSTSYVERQNLTMRMGMRRSRGYPTTPTMAAGVVYHVWALDEIAGLLDTPTQSNWPTTGWLQLTGNRSGATLKRAAAHTPSPNLRLAMRPE